MKLRTKSRLKGILLPAIAAFFLGAGVLACSSSSEEGAPDAAMAEDGAVSNTDPLANDANAVEGEEGGEAVNADGNGVPDNAANAEGNSEELSNLVNDGSANAASLENPAADPALTNNAGADPFANPAASDANAAAMAANGTENTGLNNGSDPFAPADGTDATAAENTAAVDNPAATDPALAGGDMAADAMGTDAAPMDPATDPLAAAPVEGEVATNAVPTEGEPAPAAAEAPAAPSAAGGYVPENGTKMAYYIQKGDSLGSIAQKIFGDKAKWKELAAANNLQDPNKIYPGDALYYTVGDSSRGFADKYEAAPRQSVAVAQGDTLSTISAKVYGSEASWRTLWKENPQVKNPDRIFPGQTLFYRSATASASTEPLTETENVVVTQETEQE
ncbi:MAG: LysM peptidoglycan-binding domain-containing protein [Silvanigrellales bacterium]|nr:LysM peptidoglycan-binding domain-containing protein [Silvanigrellales bacterium]